MLKTLKMKTQLRGLPHPSAGKKNGRSMNITSQRLTRNSEEQATIILNTQNAKTKLKTKSEGRKMEGYEKWKCPAQTRYFRL